MHEYSFSVFPNENFLDLRLFQYGWEQCAPLHSFGPFVRNHFLFHYVISGRGCLHSNGPDGSTRYYDLEANQGFLICPGQVNTYYADKDDPWKYTWVEFDGLRAQEFLDAAFTLKPGEISGIVESDYGYHILLRKELTENQLATVAESHLADYLDQQMAEAMDGVVRSEKLDSIDAGTFFTEYRAAIEAMHPADDATDGGADSVTPGSTNGTAE